MTGKSVGKRAGATASVRLQDIADRCGVSLATVSFALRNDPRIREVTKERIRAAARDMGYNPNTAARRLSMQRHGSTPINHLVALVVPQNFQRINYFMHLFKGILDILSEKGYGLLCCYPPDDFLETDLPLPVLRDEIDGVILPSIFGSTQRIIEIIRARSTFHAKPIVSLFDPYEATTSVSIDECSGGYQIGRHLLALGHRHVIHYFVKGYLQMQRLAGLQAAFAEQGLDPDTHLHMAGVYRDDTQPRDPSQEERLGTCWNAMQALPQATAIIARSDAHAISIWNTLASHGVRIPDDISLIGYTDSDAFTGLSGENLLTTVRVPLSDAGRHAAEMMVKLIAGDTQEPASVKIPVELIARASTAAVNPR